MIKMPYFKAANLAKFNVCGICLGALYVYYDNPQSCEIRCYLHGTMTKDTIVSKRVAQQVENDRAGARIEIISSETNQPKSPDDIIRELGY